MLGGSHQKRRTNPTQCRAGKKGRALSFLLLIQEKKTKIGELLHQGKGRCPAGKRRKREGRSEEK